MSAFFIWLRSIQQALAEKSAQFIERRQRYDVGDVLIRAHHNHTTALAIHATHIEDIPPGLKVRAEHFLRIAQAEAPFRRTQKRMHGFDTQVAMGLLKDSSHIDDCVYVLTCRRMPSYWRGWIVCQPFAQGPKRR